jgi:hypothetical protein
VKTAISSFSHVLHFLAILALECWYIGMGGGGKRPVVVVRSFVPWSFIATISVLTHVFPIKHQYSLVDSLSLYLLHASTLVELMFLFSLAVRISSLAFLLRMNHGMSQQSRSFLSTTLSPQTSACLDTPSIMYQQTL